MTPALALTNAARLLASHADGTIQCPAQAETALAVALDCLQQAAALSPETFGEQALLDKLTRDLHPEVQFSLTMLPILGVTWHEFETLREAEAFAAWAESETADFEHPCEAFVTRTDHGTAFEVKVRNW
jgi:hypothetical protein